MRAMNILLCIALTTGILSGLWGWVAVSLGLLSWAGFLGCTAYFACPQGGVKGLFISGCTLMSGVIWALVIVKGSALAPHLEPCAIGRRQMQEIIDGMQMDLEQHAVGVGDGGPYAEAGYAGQRMAFEAVHPDRENSF